MTYTITILAFLLILITFARYLLHMRKQLKEAEETNDKNLKRNCELVDQLNAIESKMHDVTVGEGDRIIPLLPGTYRIEGVCSGDRKECETGCKTFTGGEVKHHKDCLYYPDSLSKYYDDLQTQNEDLIEQLKINWKERCQKIMDWIIMPQIKAADRHLITIKVPAFYPELELPSGYYGFPDMEYIAVSDNFDYKVSEPEASEFPLEAFEGKEFNPYTKEYDIDPNWNWGERERLMYYEVIKPNESNKPIDDCSMATQGVAH